jgi:hypothetical protein
MPNNKHDSPDSTKTASPSKRAKSLPGFRVCPTVERPSLSGSQVTTLKKTKGRIRARTGQRKTDHVHQRAESPLDSTVFPGSQPSQTELQIDLEATPLFDASVSSPDSHPPPTATSSKPRCERSNKNAVSSHLFIGSILISA